MESKQARVVRILPYSFSGKEQATAFSFFLLIMFVISFVVSRGIAKSNKTQSQSLRSIIEFCGNLSPRISARLNDER